MFSGVMRRGPVLFIFLNSGRRFPAKFEVADQYPCNNKCAPDKSEQREPFTRKVAKQPAPNRFSGINYCRPSR